MATWLNNMFPGELPAEGGSVGAGVDYSGLLNTVQNSPAAMNVVNNNPQVKALYDQYLGSGTLPTAPAPTPAPVLGADRQAAVASALGTMPVLDGGEPAARSLEGSRKARTRSVF
jgi:hypothetical protein